MAMRNCLTFILLTLQAWITLAEKYCHEKETKILLGYIYYSDKYFYCDPGCCGSLYNRYCCLSSIGAIIGGAVGGIFFIVCCIVVIILIYKCNSQRGVSGAVLNRVGTPQQSNTVAVITHGQSQLPQMQHTQSYIQARQPMAYHNQQVYSPPAHPVASSPPYMSNEATQPPPYYYYNPLAGDKNYSAAVKEFAYENLDGQEENNAYAEPYETLGEAQVVNEYEEPI